MFFSDVAHRPLSFWIFYLKGERKVKITIRYGEQLFIVDVSENIYLALDENRRKAENLYHEKRRHWDARAFDESIMLLMQQHPDNYRQGRHQCERAQRH